MSDKRKETAPQEARAQEERKNAVAESQKARVQEEQAGEYDDISPSDRVCKLMAERAGLLKREREIQKELESLSAAQLAESRTVTPVDHQKRLRAASEELRKAGMISSGGGRRRTEP